MTIQYYIGGKIVGLAADVKPTSVPANTTFIESDTFTEFIFDGVATWNQIGAPILPVGGWKELGRTTLGVSGRTIDVSGLDDKHVRVRRAALVSLIEIQSAMPPNAVEVILLLLNDEDAEIRPVKLRSCPIYRFPSISNASPAR